MLAFHLVCSSSADAIIIPNNSYSLCHSQLLVHAVSDGSSTPVPHRRKIQVTVQLSMDCGEHMSSQNQAPDATYSIGVFNLCFTDISLLPTAQPKAGMNLLHSERNYLYLPPQLFHHASLILTAALASISAFSFYIYGCLLFLVASMTFLLF